MHLKNFIVMNQKLSNPKNTKFSFVIGLVTYSPEFRITLEKENEKSTI